MKNILIVTGSARPQSVNSAVVKEVEKNLAGRDDVSATVADLAAMELPFMNGVMPPSQPAYEITDTKVQAWSDMVMSADGVIFVMPEYNHNLSAIQKNALDWLYKEWQQKPAAVVAYGAYAGAHTLAVLTEMNTVLKLDLVATPATFKLGEAIGYDGSMTDEAAVQAVITTTVNELLAKL
jgi:NAD(P)H-dependent FMN reductase